MTHKEFPEITDQARRRCGSRDSTHQTRKRRARGRATEVGHGVWGSGFGCRPAGAVFGCRPAGAGCRVPASRCRVPSAGRCLKDCACGSGPADQA
ncbi:hypothetical protein DLE01_15390 [Streptomyces sp. FT05W]|nr:hypothetical protein DLE01_15390 [Streptomyces sp. FT05W]